MMKMSRSKLTLNIQQIIEITLGIEDYSAVLKGHSQYQAAQDWHDDLTDAFEAAIHCPEASVLKIVQKPVMTVHDAKATRESVAEWFMLVDERDMADKIYPDSAILTISRADLAELIKKSPTTPLPDKFRNCEIAQAITSIQKKSNSSTHGNSTRFGDDREEVLEFALYCLMYFREQCETIPKFAETIDEKSGLKWPNDGKPPLSRATIEKRLRSALNI
jgi:hypothetical protein